jgi:hypothetical protein
MCNAIIFRQEDRPKIDPLRISPCIKSFALYRLIQTWNVFTKTCTFEDLSSIRIKMLMRNRKPSSCALEAARSQGRAGGYVASQV